LHQQGQARLNQSGPHQGSNSITKILIVKKKNSNIFKFHPEMETLARLGSSIKINISPIEQL
jgi:hypothetical protein